MWVSCFKIKLIIIYYGFPTGGTELTISFCIKEHKPYLLIDAEEISIERAILRMSEFIQYKEIINIAGPRASGEPRAYDYTKEVMLGCFSQRKM